MRIPPIWSGVLSDLFVNIAAGWFVAVLIDPQVTPITSSEDLLLLIVRFLYGTVSLMIAKKLREEAINA